MTEQLILPKDLAQDLADWTVKVPYDVSDWHGISNGVVEIFENRHTGDEKRWTSIHELVIKTADGRLWRRFYEVGLTEYQDGYETFEDEGAEIPFDEVRRVPVEAYTYEPV